MLPILLKLGPLTIYSYGLFLFLGLFAGLYWWWKIGRDEHWEETTLFDIYFAALLAFLVLGRVVYVIQNPPLQTLSMAMSLLSHPGYNVWAGLIGVGSVVAMFVRKHEWDGWKVADAAVVVLSTIIVIASVGALLNGSTPGLVSSVLGYIHPGDTVPRIPVDGWTFIWSLGLFATVSRVRKNFRFYAWYKGEASVAKEGLTVLMGGLLLGFYLLVYGLITEGIRVWVVPGSSLIGVVIMLFSVGMIYWRSGKHRPRTKGGHI